MLSFTNNSMISFPKKFCKVLNSHLTIKHCLVFPIAHLNIFMPNSNTKGLLGLANSGSTTSHSLQDNIFDSIFYTCLMEEILFITNSNAAFLWFPISFTCFYQSFYLVAFYLFGTTIILLDISKVVSQLKSSLRLTPQATVKSINTAKCANTCHLPLVLIFGINLVNHLTVDQLVPLELIVI